MNLFFILGVLYKGLKAMVFFGTYWFLIKFIIFCCGSVYVYITKWGHWWRHLPGTYLQCCMMWILTDGIADFTNNTMFKPVSRLSSQFFMHFWNAELVITFMLMFPVSLNVFLSVHVMWKKSSPKPENVDWQGIWRGWCVGTCSVMGFHSWTPVGTRETKQVFKSGTVQLRQIWWGTTCLGLGLCLPSSV